MPAQKEVSDIKKLGIIAGGGRLPVMLVEECRRRGIDVFIIGFHGQTEDSLMAMAPHKWAAFGSVGLIFNSLKNYGVSDLVMIGKIRRPSLWEIRPDFKAARILTRICLRSLGDDGLLSALRKELEAEGFSLHGVHKFCTDLLAQPGYLGDCRPTEEQSKDIDLGILSAKEHGRNDIGQSVVVWNGSVIGQEGSDGTDALIARCAQNIEDGKAGPILIKTCKPQQDKDLDMPTIGPETIHNAHRAGFSGVIFESGATLVVDAKIIAKLANDYNMFVKAVSISSE